MYVFHAAKLGLYPKSPAFSVEKCEIFSRVGWAQAVGDRDGMERVRASCRADGCGIMSCAPGPRLGSGGNFQPKLEVHLAQTGPEFGRNAPPLHSCLFYMDVLFVLPIMPHDSRHVGSEYSNSLLCVRVACRGKNRGKRAFACLLGPGRGNFQAIFFTILCPF